jgi:hypothetical protein
MLLNFAVTNYRSIKERQVFSLMAVEDLPHKDSLIRSKDGIPILPVALLFGANASGKSNILRAFGMMRQMVVDSVRLNPDDTLDEYEPFLLDEESRNNDTEFEAEFIIHEGKEEEQHYLYGFAFAEEQIAEEWLYKLTRDTEKVELFIRNGSTVQINEEAFPEGKDKEGTLASNRLLLSLIAQLNGEKSKVIIEWFKKSFFIIAQQTRKYKRLTYDLLRPKESLEKIEDRKYAQMALTFIYNIDVRISELSIREEQITLPQDLPEELIKRFLAKVGDLSLTLESTHNRYDINGNIIGKEIFSIEDNESEGTQKVIDLLGVLFSVLAEGRLLVIDELDAKLHPLLTRAIIQLFTNPKINEHGAQLVFTTHDTNQLNLGYVRRDEIWFTEKSCVEATELYSHIEFKDFDQSMDIAEQYVNGRYGAIPRIKTKR